MIRAATVKAIQDELAAHLRSRTEWDEEPALFILHSGENYGAHMAKLPVPEVLWSAVGHPPTAVMRMADRATGLPRWPDGSHMFVPPWAGPLLGVAFRYEAYALSSDSPSLAVQEAARRRTAGGSVPRFKDIPGRMEQRCMTAVDLDGGRYMASATRIAESGQEATEPAVHYLAFADPKRDTLSGKVVDAANRFLNAIKPVPTKGTATP